MDEENESKLEAACPECGGNMVEDDGDESMVKCEKCDYRMPAEDAGESVSAPDEE
ncbi:MAG: hypothetical protein V4438_00810 [Patescibacteria group bacterium]